MNYRFLKKAKSQPDLLDFCEYIKKPLSVLEDILDRYNELQVSKKAEISNLETYHKCDSILEKHLPQMIDNYCDFTFDFRNKNKVNINGKDITPKELLLQNLAKIVEEVDLIEKEFNENNLFIATVQNKVLSNYGYQPEYCLETGKIIKNGLVLENKFDYETFVPADNFKKTESKNINMDVLNTDFSDDSDIQEVDNFKKTESKNINMDVINTDFSDDSDIQEVFNGLNDNMVVVRKESHSSFSLIEVILFIGLISFILIGVFVTFGSIENQAKSVSFQNNILNLNSGIKNYYFDGKYDSLSNQKLINENVVLSDTLNTTWDKKMNIYPATITTKNDAYAIDIPLSSNNYKSDCLVSSLVADQFEIINLDGVNIKNTRKEKPLSADHFALICSEKPHNNITLITK